ncbi:RICIN domain-containing protein [Solirubrobacter soli]|uniref:RICIN domain-containing protein n=1 Tax=Solirubrobacter soli TaxID=363832 RepID=UPI0004151E3C|nr:RICIN domain-containing protein [Solirubrobacter soli]
MKRLVLTLTTAVVAAGAMTASANADIAPGVYRISPGHATSKAVEAQNFGTSSTTKIVQNPFNGNLNQRWRIKKTGQVSSGGASFYSLSPEHAPNLCLDVPNASTSAGVRVNLQSCNAFRVSQRWHIFVRDPGLFQITNRNSSMGLQVSGGSLSNNAQLIQGTGIENPLSKFKQFKMTKLAN